jgi:RNA recognition motif-containing protein
VEKKPKGFGYVEFASLEGLKQALALNGSQFAGRNVRVSVAEPREYCHNISKHMVEADSLQPRIGKRLATLVTGRARVPFLLCPMTSIDGRQTEDMVLETLTASPMLVVTAANVAAPPLTKVMERFATSAIGNARVPSLH